MKTCKDFFNSTSGVMYCSYCRGMISKDNYKCWVERFRIAIEENISDNSFKKEAIGIMKSKLRPIPYFIKALEYYYPEHYGWYKKMLLLK